jgi:hypothetical protein
MMRLDLERFNKVKGARVESVVRGVGTFINIFLVDIESYTRFQIWLYLCEWAITKDTVEVVSSDTLDEQRRLGPEFLLDHQLQLVDICVLDSEELHLIFTSGIVIEIWGNKTLYGNESEMMVLFVNGIFETVVSLTCDNIQ